MIWCIDAASADKGILYFNMNNTNYDWWIVASCSQVYLYSDHKLYNQPLYKVTNFV